MANPLGKRTLLDEAAIAAQKNKLQQAGALGVPGGASQRTMDINMGGSRGTPNPAADAKINALMSKMGATMGGSAADKGAQAQWQQQALTGANAMVTNVYNPAQGGGAGAMDRMFQTAQGNQTAAAPAGGAPAAGTGYQSLDYDALYANIGNARKAALDAAMQNQQQQLAAQGNALTGQYNDQRSQAYTNARVSALGNNERMASTGLAGAANAGPQSGYSETSRIAQDTTLGNALNMLNAQEQGARNDLATQGNSARLTHDQNLSDAMADLDREKIANQTQDNQFRATYDQENARMAEDTRRYNEGMEYQRGRDAINDQRYTDETTYQHGRDAVADEQWNKDYGIRMQDAQDRHSQIDKDNAWTSVNTLGYVDDAASKILGIPTGTKTEQAREFQQQLDFQKSRGGGGGGGTDWGALLAALLGGGDKPAPKMTQTPTTKAQVTNMANTGVIPREALASMTGIPYTPTLPKRPPTIYELNH